MAQRRPKREIKPPGEWWKVKPSATPVQDSSSDEEVEAEVKEEEEDSDDELDLLGNTAHSAQEASWPSNWHAAMKRSDADEWRQAAQEEIDAHIANGTWEPCSLPPGKKAIGS